VENQLQDEIVAQFEVGVVHGNSVVLVHNREDGLDSSLEDTTGMAEYRTPLINIL